MFIVRSRFVGATVSGRHHSPGSITSAFFSGTLKNKIKRQRGRRNVEVAAIITSC